MQVTAWLFSLDDSVPTNNHEQLIRRATLSFFTPANLYSIVIAFPCHRVPPNWPHIQDKLQETT